MVRPDLMKNGTTETEEREGCRQFQGHARDARRRPCPRVHRDGDPVLVLRNFSVSSCADSRRRLDFQKQAADRKVRRLL